MAAVYIQMRRAGPRNQLGHVLSIGISEERLIIVILCHILCPSTRTTGCAMSWKTRLVRDHTGRTTVSGLVCDLHLYVQQPGDWPYMRGGWKRGFLMLDAVLLPMYIK